MIWTALYGRSRERRARHHRLYVRLAIHETPVLQEALTRRERVKLPMLVAGLTMIGLLAARETKDDDLRRVA